MGESDGLACEALELAPLAIEKTAPLDEILRRIAADDLFGKTGDGDVGVGHLFRDLINREALEETAPTVGLTLAAATFARRIVR